MIKQDIISAVVSRIGISKGRAQAAVECVLALMKQALSRGERIELRGFAIFDVRAGKTGIGRNPRSGVEVALRPGKAVRFRPGKGLQALE